MQPFYFNMKLHFRKYGVGEPLIILHGLFGSSDNWQTLGKKFAEKFTVYLVDQRNHGHSPHADDMNYSVMSDDLLELMQDEQISKAHLLGHSMGGKTVMQFATQHEDKINKLIVADIGPKEYPSHHDIVFKALFAVDLEHTKTRGEAESVIRSIIDDTGTVQFILKNLYWTENNQLQWRFNLNVLHENIHEILKSVPVSEINVPTLFIRGAKSNYILDDDFDGIYSQFKNAEIKTIENAGHWVHAEKPLEFYQIVAAFLA